MKDEILDYINSIVFSSDKPDGIPIGTCYTMAAEKFKVSHQEVVDLYLKYRFKEN
jgi:hypothetical protein